MKGLSTILNFLKEQKKELIILCSLALVSAGANGIVPYLIGRLLDSAISPSKIFIGTALEMPVFVFYLLFWLLVKLTADLVDWRTSIKSEYLGGKIYGKYIIRAFSKLLEMPLSFHKNHKMGDIIDRIQRGASEISKITDSVIINLSPQFLSIIIALAVAFTVNYELASILVIAVSIYAFVLFRTIAPLGKRLTQMHKTYNTAFGDAHDAILNIQSVKQAIAEEHEKKKLTQRFYTKYLKALQNLVAIWININFYQRIIVTATQLIIFSLSVYMIKQGEMTLGDLVMFTSYSMMLFAPFLRLGNYWQAVQNGLVSAERTEKILSVPAEIYVPENAAILPEINGKITFQNASFSFQKKQQKVLDNVSFEIKPGQTVALVGGSGMGKTTIAELISGYYFPTGGKVLIDGHNIKTIDLKFLRNRIGVVPQEIILFNDTVANNIKYGSFGATDEEVVEAAKKAQADDFIEKFPKKYEQIVGERGIRLSAGQKQRIAIARAILRNPKILILDEPTSSLDAQSEKFLQESVEKLMKNRTTIIIAHRLSTVQKADNILVLDKGQIAEQGKHEELIQIPDGIYLRLYELQIGLK